VGLLARARPTIVGGAERATMATQGREGGNAGRREDGKQRQLGERRMRLNLLDFEFPHTHIYRGLTRMLMGFGPLIYRAHNPYYFF